jgi:hypothetical protein
VGVNILEDACRHSSVLYICKCFVVPCDDAMARVDRKITLQK